MKTSPFLALAGAGALLMLVGIAGASQLVVYSGSGTTGTPFNYADSSFPQQLVGKGTTIEPVGQGDAGMKTESTSGIWFDTDRICMIFDLSGLPAGATVTSATIDVPGHNKYVTFTAPNPAPTWGISGYTPTVQGQVNIADFQTNGSIRFNTGDISYPALDSSGTYGHNVWTLNPAGLAYLTPGSKAAFMVRINWDLDSANPGWQSLKFGYFNIAPANGTFPKLTVNYVTQSPPAASFSANVTTGTAPLSVRFTDTSTGSPTGWNWSFGDGNSSTLQNPVYVYPSPGSYTVSLTATNAYGSNTTSRAGYITVNPGLPPAASLSTNITAGNAPLPVQFIDTSTGSPTSWNWSFGDGNSSTLQNPVYIYPSAGSYTVSLTATNAYGSNTTTRAGYVTVNPGIPPAASISANGTTGNAPLPVQFTDTSAGSPTGWNWSFGDGNSSTLQNPVYVYPSPGSYTVSLTATNSYGSNTTTRAGYITITAGTPPVAGFTANPTSGSAPLSVQFTDSSTASPISWVWIFTNVTGNNTPVIFSTARNPVQIFGGGNFSISLNATNQYGSNATPPFLHWVNVSAPAGGGTGYDAATTVMLHMNATPTVDDLHATWVKDNPVTANGTIFRFGGYSGQFTSPGYDMITNARTPYNMGTGDFTVEGWVYFTNFTNNINYFISSGIVGSPVNLFDVMYRAAPDNYWAFCDHGNCTSFGDIPGNTQTNQWYAFAVVRVAGVDSFYVNGNLIGSRPDTTNIALGSNMIEIGSLSKTLGFTGYLDEIRVSKGIGRYTGSSYALQTREFGT